MWDLMGLTLHRSAKMVGFRSMMMGLSRYIDPGIKHDNPIDDQSVHHTEAIDEHQGRRVFVLKHTTISDSSM
ncbi:hypothetical protein L6452_04156 [Arctium lappa]|uniref:Uncharacterized protein n=1 Tax=Arctium lappa TaxID=4217 RepID=A0ACB9FQ81_ARCLA|nr:hypothetical protein L6452_04156 [Arctium lappa]